MSAVKSIIVCTTILFTLYFIGAFNMVLQLALNTIPSLSSIVKIKEVPDHAPADPLAGMAGMAKVDQIIASKKIEMSNQMKQVLVGLEDLIKDMNLDTLNEQERRDALAELYEKFPVMEATLSKSLEMDSEIGIDPAVTVDHQNRLASIKILLDESKPKSNTQKGNNILDKENSHESEFENNISDHASKSGESSNENSVNDPLEGANVHQKDNTRTEL